MAHFLSSIALQMMLPILHLLVSGSGVLSSATFTIVNKCEYTVWPGILSNAGIAQLSTTGFALQRDESCTVNVPSSWGGRFWGRTHCNQDSSTGKFSCVTGDCGSGKVECAGNNAAPPATLAEFTLDGSGGMDFYDVSLVDGYNLPMLVVPQGGTGANCTSTGCVVDLNGSCPSELRVSSAGESVACKSACMAFGQAQYCCSGAYGSPDTCKPSSYAQLFKKACPRAYSYAYDDKSSTFTCAGAADYLITFCPSPGTSQKSSEGRNPASSSSPNSPPMDSSMVYEGAWAMNRASSPFTFKDGFGSLITIAGTVGVAIAIWPARQLV